MKVLFDPYIFQIQRIGGVSKALVEMMRHLPSDIKVEIAIKESDNVYLNENGGFGQVISEKRVTFERFIPKWDFRGKARLYRTLCNLHVLEDSNRKNLEYCISRMNKGDYDVLQPTGYNSYFLPYNKKPFVFIVHDIIPELFPQFFPRDFCDIREREILVRSATHIVVPSECTKKDVLKWWRINEKKVSVIPWGAPKVDLSSFTNRIDFPYILFVGERDRYKRFSFFVSEAADFLKNHSEIQVICTGKNFSASEIDFFASLGLNNRFHARFISSEELSSLYHFALCLVFPSQYEGFGLPILEAMACGCPVILSNSSCFPEVGGKTALYIEEHKDGHSNLSEVLASLYNMPSNQRTVLVQKCIERAKLFSWQETANNYAEIYNSLN